MATEKKEYHTKQHEQLLDFFEKHPHDSFSAREIIEEPSLDMGEATVYRLLSRMTRDGDLLRAAAEGGGSRYTRNPQRACSGHLHLKCTRCSEVICADKSVLTGMSERLGDALGFSVDSEMTTIYGLCGSCRSEEGKR